MSHGRESDRLRSASSTNECLDFATNSESMSQAASKKDYPQHISVPDTDARDTDSVRHVSSSEEYHSSASRQAPSRTPPYESAGRRHDNTIPTTSTMQRRPSTRVPSKQAPSHSDRRSRTVPTKQSPSLLGRLSSILNLSAESPSTSPDSEQERNTREGEVERLREALCKKDNMITQNSKDYEKESDNLKRNFQSVLESKEMDFERYIGQMKREKDETIHSLQAEIQKIKSDRDLIQTKHVTFVRQQQEEAFKQMESARWLPPEESKVLGNFDRIKRDMKSWAKGTSIKDTSLIQELGEKDLADLMNGLSDVVLLQENQLPQGLSTPRAPALLLNALLAHNIYRNLFRNPFFFLKDGLGDNLPRAGLEQILDKIYSMAQDSDQRDAHIWRSQTLRLLLPPVRNDSREGEKALRSWIEDLIAKVSDRNASDFIASPARFLIDHKAIAKTTKKLKTIYQEVASISYMLWTRRTTMKCVTLQEMCRPIFDIESPYLVPHPLVHPENHEDQLKGRPITVIVHPLLQVYGTDEAMGYDEGRVWVPAEVWFDSN